MPRRLVLRPLLPWLAAWLLLGALGCGVLVVQARAQQREDFETQARIVHRLLSQRAVQHDAVLGTLALLQPPAGPDELQRLAALYPQLLKVAHRAPGTGWTEPALQAAEAASRAARRPVAADVDFARGRFWLVLAADPGSFALQVDAHTAVPWSDWPMPPDTSPIRVALEHAGQSFTLQPGREGGSAWRFEFRKHLATDSQPFDVVARASAGWDALPWAAMGAWLLALGAALAALEALRRQQAARRRAENLVRLGQVSRLNSLGELAAGMAHELNQPLTAVIASTQAARRLLDEHEPDLATAREALQQAAGQARRASDVLARLRKTVERPDAGAGPQPLALPEAARDALHLLEPECARRGVAPRLVAPAPVQVLAEPVALGQIAHNLLLNALQALEQVPPEERELVVTIGVDGAQGVLAVEDSGPGVPPEQLPRLFEPFFTTRRDGLGLGLSLSESLAVGMGGRLVAGPRAARGACFRLALPLAGSPA